MLLALQDYKVLQEQMDLMELMDKMVFLLIKYGLTLEIQELNLNS